MTVKFADQPSRHQPQLPASHPLPAGIIDSGVLCGNLLIRGTRRCLSSCLHLPCPEHHLGPMKLAGLTPGLQRSGPGGRLVHPHQAAR